MNRICKIHNTMNNKFHFFSFKDIKDLILKSVDAQGRKSMKI